MTSDSGEMKDACMGAAGTGPEHEGIARLEGTWRAEVKMWMGPQGEPMVSQGTMKNTMVLGGRFLQEAYEDDAGMYEGRGFWGYNTTEKRYEGLWIDAMATFFQLEHGAHDASTDTYTMHGSMTNPANGQTMKKRSVIRVLSPTEHTMEVFFQTGDGKESKSMEIRYVRA